MRLGFIGLGRMGKNMVLHLLEKNHEVVAFDSAIEPIKEVEKKGAIAANSIQELMQKLSSPKIVWIMVPAGEPVDEVIAQLLPFLQKEDIVIDGGNSFFEDSIRRAKQLEAKAIHFLDIGTSGGIEGARHVASMMIGGNKQAFKKIEPIIKHMCVENGYGYMGESGSGHFVKMVHNGIEYGMMSALGEGMQALKSHEQKFSLNLDQAVKAYAHGSIIEGKLSSWLWNSFQQEGYLEEISCIVPKGETEEEMKKLSKLSEMPILEESIAMRERTREKEFFAGKIIAALRNQFGGHKVIKEK